MREVSKAITALSTLGDYIVSKPTELHEIIQIAYQHNGWFSPDNCWRALFAIANDYLNEEKLASFASSYQIPTSNPKTVGLILAGNLPLVSFHDILCVLLSGHNAQIKLSSKDDKLTRAILMKLGQLSENFNKQIEIVDRLSDYDAVIATGSDNSVRYFEQYFGNYPNIIRGNRTSLAVLTGSETKVDYQNLGKDVFYYYGLGCRNVTFLLVPTGFNFEPLLNGFAAYENTLNNQKYKNNFDYNLTLFLINTVPHLQGDAIILSEEESLHSRIAVLHYKEYKTKDDLNNFIIKHNKDLQVVVGKEFTPFGQAQEPTLSDFADHVDTMAFLSKL